MNQAWIANRVKQKKNEQTKQLPRKLEITFASFYSSNFFLGECERSIYEKKESKLRWKKYRILYLLK